MKRNLSLCLILFSLGFACLNAQSRELEFFWSLGRNARLTENRMNYQILTGPRSQIGIRASTGTDDRLNFNQKSRRTAIDMNLKLQGKWLSHQFDSGFEYLNDSSSLEQELSPYLNKTAFLGYGMLIQPLDSLSFNFAGKGIIRREQDRYSADGILQSDGVQVDASVKSSLQISAALFGINAFLQDRSMDWESFRQTGIRAWAIYESRDWGWQNTFNWDYREDDLYILEQEHNSQMRGVYQLSDMQKRNSFGFTSFAQYQHPSDALKINFSDILSHRYISLENNGARNNTDMLNQATIELLSLPFPHLSFNTRANYNYGLKDFSYLGNKRYTELRGLSARLAWEYSEADSLITHSYIELARSRYPLQKHRWDNDLLTRSFSLGSVNYWRSRIRLATWLSWTIKDDVYIDGTLSANNKQVNSLVLVPDCSIILGDRLSFNQSYQVRAEYTDYMYEGKANGLYRQLGYRYALRFDSYPLLARTTNPVWLLLPYRQTTGKALLFETSFAYEENEYADAIQDYYAIFYKNKRYTGALMLKYDIPSLYFIVEPKYSWGTWKEYSLLFGLSWRFNNQSLLEVSINPVGESLDLLDWRSSVNLSLRF